MSLYPLGDHTIVEKFFDDHHNVAQHPWLNAQRMALAIHEREVTLAINDDVPGPCVNATDESIWRPMLGLLAIRENLRPNARCVLAIEAFTPHAQAIYRDLCRITTNRRNFIIGTLAQFCMARYEDEDPPETVLWQFPDRIAGTPTQVIVMGFSSDQGHWQSLCRQEKEARIAPPEIGNGVFYDGVLASGFSELWKPW